MHVGRNAVVAPFRMSGLGIIVWRLWGSRNAPRIDEHLDRDGAARHFSACFVLRPYAAHTEQLQVLRSTEQGPASQGRRLIGYSGTTTWSLQNKGDGTAPNNRAPLIHHLTTYFTTTQLPQSKHARMRMDQERELTPRRPQHNIHVIFLFFWGAI